MEVTPEHALFINERIRENYAVNWLVDGLPAAESKEDANTNEIFYDIGFDLGNSHGQFHNHFDIVLKYHKRSADQLRVVGVLVWPHSKARHDSDASSPNCGPSTSSLTLSETSKTKFYYTYSVSWQESPIAWVSWFDVATGEL